jgi:hypothetical protein
VIGLHASFSIVAKMALYSPVGIGVSRRPAVTFGQVQLRSDV